MSEERKRKPYTVLELPLAESRRQDFVVMIPSGVPTEDLLAKEFLMHVAERLNQYDTIECQWEDGTRVVRLRVLWAEKALAKVAIMSEEQYGESEVVFEDEEYAVKWRGPYHKFTVLRGDKVIETGFQERPLAEAWIVENRV